jgi:hypothetical protein
MREKTLKVRIASLVCLKERLKLELYFFVSAEEKFVRELIFLMNIVGQ